MLIRTPLADRARGRWRGILTVLGVDPNALTGNHGPCPMCGGKDRFRFDNKNGGGSWICSKCGSGDGAELLKRKTGKEFRDVARDVDSVIGAALVDGPSAPPVSQDRLRASMNALWRSGVAPDLSNEAGRYLHSRCRENLTTRSLRAVESMRYNHGAVGVPQTEHPGMVAMLVDPMGKPVTLHRTYLAAGGRKADVPSPRRMMPGVILGSAVVRLSPLAGGTIGIAEGIETAISAGIIHGMPCWAATNTSLLTRFQPPGGVDTVIVFGDNDANLAGQAAAYALAHKLVDRYAVEVRIPPDTGDDWNDVHRRQMEVQ